MSSIIPNHGTPVRETGSPWPLSEAASYLRISTRHLLRLIGDGRIKSIRIGRRAFVSDPEVTRISVEGVK